MGIEGLVPGVQDGHKAQFSTKLVLAEAKQGPGDGLKQDVEHHGLVTKDHGVKLVGQGKDEVEVLCRQKLGFSRLKPAFPRYVLTGGAVSVTAATVGDTLGATVSAALDVAAEISGAATGDIRDDLSVLRPQSV